MVLVKNPIKSIGEIIILFLKKIILKKNQKKMLFPVKMLGLIF
tara:strand:- start:10 stop:138 length:129 start_codon:yes stop_codon:yes gene_type:complete